MAGTLYVVATPIGNLEDLTFRALRTLKEVDVIAAEDTRRTSKLLAHYRISKPLLSLHEHNEFREAPRLVNRLLAGESIAVVSDAGTPGISDPGATIVRLARKAGVPIVPVPGPSALTTTLSVSGLALTSFLFCGFPPTSGTARNDWLQRVAEEPGVVIFFEAPHRIAKTVDELRNILVNRDIFVHREITKKHEEFVECQNKSELGFRQDGEFVVVIGERGPESTSTGEKMSLAVEMIGRITNSGALSREEALIAASAVSGISLRKLRKAAKKAAIEAKRQSQTTETPSS